MQINLVANDPSYTPQTSYLVIMDRPIDGILLTNRNGSRSTGVIIDGGLNHMFLNIQVTGTVPGQNVSTFLQVFRNKPSVPDPEELVASWGEITKNSFFFWS